MDRETEGKKSEREKGRERTKEYSRFARLIEKRANEPLFSSREPVSHEGTFSPFRRGAVHLRGRVTLRAHSASPRRPSTDLTQELRGRNASGIGARFRTSTKPTTNHFFSLSSVSSLFRYYCHSRQSASPSSCYRSPLQLQQQVRTHFVSKSRKRSITSTSTAPFL